MIPELKKKWIEALRSGKYIQGREFLYRHNTYCCLGVLCSIMMIDRDDNLYFVDDKGTHFNDRLLDEIREFIGLNPYQEDKLIKMNDSCYSFSEIADWIERNVDDSYPMQSE